MKFSVVIPAYKKKFLKVCIESILGQTYKNFELIIVNDASPEDLDSVIDLFSDPRIFYYKNTKNCGAIDVVDNWNICLKYATGDYLICMGDDDMLAPQCLDEYARLIDKYPNVDLFHSRVKQIDEMGNFVKLTDSRNEWESVLSMIWYRMIYRQQYIGDYLFRISTLREKGGFYKLPYAWASDDITAYIIAKDNGVVHTDYPLFYYRINSQTISSTGKTEVKMQALLKTDDWYKCFVENYKVSNEIDKYLKLMIEKELARYSNRQKTLLISYDLNRSLFRIFRWIRLKKEYSIPISVLIYAFVVFIKNNKRTI